MSEQTIAIRGQAVRLIEASHMRGRCAYQGGDYFEFRADGGCWHMSQSPERAYHDPARIVGTGRTIQDAADALARGLPAPATTGAISSTAMHRLDLTSASIDALIGVLGEAVRLGYVDGVAERAVRTAPAIAEALGAEAWTGGQLRQLRQAYTAGREQLDAERVAEPDAHGIVRLHVDGEARDRGRSPCRVRPPR